MLLKIISTADFKHLYQGLISVIVNYLAALASRTTTVNIQREINFFLRHKNVDIHVIDETNGLSLLHHAAKQGEVLDVNAINFLIAAGHKVDIQDKLGNTPLYYASVLEKERAVIALLNNKADPNLGSLGANPLLATIKISTIDEHAEINIVKALIKAGADLNVWTKEQFSPLHLAIIHRKTTLVKEIINTGKADLTHRDIDGATALHMVAEFRSQSDEEIEPHQQTSEVRKMRQEAGIAEFIIQHADAINLQDKWGNTPLHLAVINSNRFVVELLLEKDYLFPQQKVLSIKNHYGMTVFHEAVRKIVMNPVEGKAILILLLRAATQKDLASMNNDGETALELVDSLINTPEIEGITASLDRNIDNLDLIVAGIARGSCTNYQSLVVIADRLSENALLLSRYTEELADHPEGVLVAKASELSDRIEALASSINSFTLEALELLADKEIAAVAQKKLVNSAINVIDHARELTLSSRQLSFGMGQQLKGKAYSRYLHVLYTAKHLLTQSDYFSWKNTQLALPSSFPDYEDKPRRAYESMVTFAFLGYYHNGITEYHAGNYWLAIDQLATFVYLCEAEFPQHFTRAHAYGVLGAAYQAIGSYQEAESAIQKSTVSYYDFKSYFNLEALYKFLAPIFISTGKAIEYERKNLAILEYAVDNKQSLCAHLALAGLYQVIRAGKQISLPLLAFAEDLLTRESYHYSAAYKLTQAELDPHAHVVLQREIGVADNANLGTYNIQQCVAVVVFDLESKRTVLSHFDRYSGPLTFIKQLLEQFPAKAKLDIYLSGARDRTVTGKEISDNNVDQVLKQIYFYQERFTIKAADLGDKPSPAAIIFDSVSAKLIHRIPNRPDITLHARAVEMNIQIMKTVDADYLYPLNKVIFSEPEAARLRIFTAIERQKIYQYYQYYTTQLDSESQLWIHNQFLYPFRMIAKEISAATNFRQPLLSNALETLEHLMDSFSLLDLSNTFGSLSLLQPPREDMDVEDLFTVLHEQVRYQDSDASMSGSQHLSLLASEIEESAVLLTQHQRIESIFPGCFTASSREKRNENTCLISWKDVEQFNAAAESRDIDKIKLDSEAFLPYLSQIKNKLKQAALLQLAELVEVSGSRQQDVKRLIALQKLDYHCKKLRKFSGRLNQVLIAKDTISEFIKGDYKDVAINVGLMLGSSILSKLGEESRLLGAAFVGDGKVFLGSFLKLASPFMRRGTSAFIIYDLSQQIKALKSGNNEAVIGITNDSIFVGIDLLESGVEVLEFTGIISEISSITGFVGESMGALVLFESQIYYSVKKVEHTEQFIHLTRLGKFEQGIEAFFGISDQTIDLQIYHSRLIRGVIDYLRNNPGIGRYVTPSFRTEQSCRTKRIYRETCLTTTRMFEIPCRRHSYEKCESCMAGGTGYYQSGTEEACRTNFVEQAINKVLLRREAYPRFIQQDSVFSLPENTGLFCSPELQDTETLNAMGMTCENALGVIDLSKERGALTLINVGKGTDYVYGFLYSPNLFLVKQGNKFYTGGRDNDIFLLTGYGISGYLDGDMGIDTLNIQNYAPYKKLVEIYLDYSVDNRLDNLDGARLTLQNFERILGRRGRMEIIYPGCNTTYINLQGGESERNLDRLWFLNETCDFNVTVSVNPNTFIYHNLDVRGNFSYFIPKETGSAYLSLNAKNKARTQFITEYTLFDLRLINQQSNTSHLVFHDGFQHFKLMIDNLPRNAIFRFSNKTKMILDNKENMYVFQFSDRPVPEIIKDYLPLVNRLQLSVVVHSLLNNDTVTIGHDQHDVIHNDPACSSHLIGNKGENLYVIESGQTYLTAENLPLNRVVIYHVDEFAMDTLILQKINQQIYQDLNKVSYVEMSQYEQDLYLQVFACDRKNRQAKQAVITIQLKQGINWYRNLHITLNRLNMRLVYQYNKWNLLALPLVFSREKEIIIVHPRDVETDSIIQLEKDAGKFQFLCAGAALWITNRFQTDLKKTEFYTLVLKKFYLENTKMKTLSIQFLDSLLILADNMSEIARAKNATDVFQDYQKSVYQSIFSPLPLSADSMQIPLSENSTNIDTYFRRHLLFVNDTDFKREARVVVENIDIQGALALLTIGILKWTRKQFPDFKQPYTISQTEALAYAAVITEKITYLVPAASAALGIILDNDNEQKVAWPELSLQKQLRAALMQAAPIEKIISDYIDTAYLTVVDKRTKLLILDKIKELLERDLRRVEVGLARKTAGSFSGRSGFYPKNLTSNESKLAQAPSKKLPRVGRINR